jgi:hypothetical protein
VEDYEGGVVDEGRGESEWFGVCRGQHDNGWLEV